MDDTFLFYRDADHCEEITLPNNLKIKSITSNVSGVIILTESNEILYFGGNNHVTKYLERYYNRFLKLNFELFVKDDLKMNYNEIPEIKDIFSLYNFLILKLESNEYILLYFRELEPIGLYIKSNLNMLVSSCPFGHYIMATDSNNKLTFLHASFTSRTIEEPSLTDTAKEIINKLFQKGIKSVEFGSNFSIIVTKDNKIYAEGPNSFNSQSGVATKRFEYEHVKTPFEEMSEIKQVKCGYYHTVVLLNNGKVFASGYNCDKQCGHKSTGFKLFTEFKLPIGLNVEEIGCTFRGTHLKTKDKVYFVGDIAAKFPQEEFGEVTAHCVSLKNSSTLKFNAVSRGFWHCVVYFKPSKESKELIQFKSNLQKLIRNKCLSDIYFY